MSEKEYSIADLKEKAAEIVSKKTDYRDERYLSANEIYSSAFTEFLAYLEMYDLEKQKRKQLYEQLKAESENK